MNILDEPKNCNNSPQSNYLDWPPSPNESAQREHLLAALRCGSLRMALAKADLDSVGTALKGGLISIEYAMDWLGELGAFPLLETVLEGSNAQPVG